ncbi:glycosyl transferase family 39 [Desulfurobacterium thermolithotrophum DSM 11699]|uniref:Glycosyl transferase family 39 n=1 Tax=Desulfurobacterium thermolithotrophum (strain DSM 11699 / BSA) TaxID=868864 RepID=F0S0Y3_DESTD|nr:glycosyltransferase family 39 protein [Desulfurobacterium thermolithotrophum]ADY72787.1 glycosyl transferase family 39 [Desulfurobacterium thermolithotrophum DSM 11699]
MKKEMIDRTFKLFLVFLSFALLINIGTFVLYHEEPRRGIITFEMLKTHNFFQPTVLLEPYFRKPPFHNWILAISSEIFGSVSEFSLRLPSLISVILTSVFLFFFSSKLFERKVALFSAVIFPTFFMVLFGYSTKAEPDTLFTFLVSSSIISWYYFIDKGKERIAWFLGYFFTSLAALTKGFPAFHFFLVAIFVYFFLKKDLKGLLSLNHIVGFVLGIIPFVGWILIVPTEQALKTLFSEVISRAPTQFDLLETIKRFISFPFRFLFATFPWSVIVLFYLYREKEGYKKLISDKTTLFLILTFIGNFLIYWFFPGSRMRYTMPLLPLLSILIAVYLKDKYFIHKRAKNILQFTLELIVPLGIVVGVIITGNSSLILKETIIFLIFAYLFYFYFLPRINFTPIVILFALLMLLFRGFYSSYYLPIAESKYPPVREVAKEIADLTKEYPLFTKTKYLQLCFYVEKFKNSVLPYSSKPPKDSLFLSERPEGNVLKEFSLGKHKFYLCSFSIERIEGKTLEAESRKTKLQ